MSHNYLYLATGLPMFSALEILQKEQVKIGHTNHREIYIVEKSEGLFLKYDQV